MKNVSNIRMLEDWVLVKKLKEYETEKKIGSIYLSDSSMTTARESKVGLVVAVGPGRWNKDRTFRENTIKVGSAVYCTRYEKTKFEAMAFGSIDDYMIMRERDIQAYIIFGVERIVSPLFDKIWVEEIPESKISDAGIIKPFREDDVDERWWKVLSVGSGARTKDYKVLPIGVKEDDIILASKDTGVQLSWASGDSLRITRIISEKDILCIRSK